MNDWSFVSIPYVEGTASVLEVFLYFTDIKYFAPPLSLSLYMYLYIYICFVYIVDIHTNYRFFHYQNVFSRNHARSFIVTIEPREVATAVGVWNDVHRKGHGCGAMVIP